MSTTIVLAGAAGLAGLALLVGLIFWMTRARVGEATAKAATDALVKGKEKRREADKIMSEPVADEAAWIQRARKLTGVRPDRRQP